MDALLACLHARFGLSEFRGIQRSVIEAVLRHEDTLALMPTGTGKTLCYQLPALILPGLTLVISPLSALIRDQQSRLERLGIPCIALVGELSDTLWQSAGQALLTGTKIIFLSPERASGQTFMRWLERFRADRPISLLVIDEAHCVVEWGESFRPSYLALKEVRRRLSSATCLLLTASADPPIRAQICRDFGLLPRQIRTMSFNRPEIYYQVDRLERPERTAVHLVKRDFSGKVVLIYCAYRDRTEYLARALNHVGLNARPYHAGLSPETRAQNESWFKAADNAVMVATIAFGMGIDKANVRLVIHVDCPSRLLHYVQETGRVGRDGAASYAVLLHRPLGESPGGDKGEGEVYLETRGCRRSVLLRALGEDFAGPCGACDRCCPEGRIALPGAIRHSTPWVRRRLSFA